MPERVPIGAVLVLREEMAWINRDNSNLAATRHRADLLVQLLDELIAFREKEECNTRS